MKYGHVILLPAFAQAFLSNPHPMTTTSHYSAYPLTRREPIGRLPLSFPQDNNSKNPDLQDLLKKVDINRLADNTDRIKDNILSGEVGERGEAYVALQFVMLACIFFGGLPFISGDLLSFVLGPGMFLIGLVVMLLSVLELGPSLSPWPVAGGSRHPGLIMDGPYAFVRHPIYTGLLFSCFGFSFWTESVIRLVLTGLLYKVLEAKVDFEEEDLYDTFPEEYPVYQELVTGKLFPQNFLENVGMSWDIQGETEDVEVTKEQKMTSKQQEKSK